MTSCKHITIQLMILLITFITGPLAYSESSGSFTVVKGDVQIISKDGKSEKAKIGKKVVPSDTIVSGKDSRAKVVMIDKNIINISPETKITLEKYIYDPSTGDKQVSLDVTYGKVRATVEQKYDGEKNKFHIKTPSAVAGVRGTDFLTSYSTQSRETKIITFEGRVAVGAPGPGGNIVNPVYVNPGQMTTATQGSAPTPPTAVPKEEFSKMNSESQAEPTKKEEPQPDSPPAKEDKKDKKEEGADDNSKKDAKTDGEKKDNDKQDAKKEDVKSEEKKESKTEKQDQGKQSESDSKDKGGKESASKDSSSKDSTSKDANNKDPSSKDSNSKGTGANEDKKQTSLTPEKKEGGGTADNSNKNADNSSGDRPSAKNQTTSSASSPTEKNSSGSGSNSGAGNTSSNTSASSGNTSSNTNSANSGNGAVNSPGATAPGADRAPASAPNSTTATMPPLAPPKNGPTLMLDRTDLAPSVSRDVITPNLQNTLPAIQNFTPTTSTQPTQATQQYLNQVNQIIQNTNTNGNAKINVILRPSP